jgi:hypothetical protein
MVTMGKQQPFILLYDPQVTNHLRAIETKYHPLIRANIEQKLQFEPAVETRNRKPLTRPSSLQGEWEIRFGPANRFRVFYAVDAERREVEILAVGVKQRGRLTIGGQEVTQ